MAASAVGLEWIDKYGDIDGDGFVEYARHSPTGLVQQGWKDSADSVFYNDGVLADGPIALCEVQGYVFAAKRMAAQLALALGYPERAAELWRQADTLQRRFEAVFWSETLSSYVLALDGKKRPCEVRTSNAGHCLLTGIAGPERAWLTAQTLMREDLFTGWGVRTLGSSEVRFNPMSYHNGSVWPHDNALVAWGIARYGFKEPVHKILTGLFDASLFVDLHRLPELFCGFVRRTGEGPTLYPVACAPQAWAAGSVFLLLQACLGLSIHGADERIRLLRPDFAGIFAGSADRKSSRRSGDGGSAASTPSTGREHSRTAHGRSNRHRKTGSGPNADPLRPFKDLEKAVRMTRQWRGWALILIGTMASFVGLLGDPVQANERTREQLRRAKVFLAAGDYRRAVEACLREVVDSPSVESYVYITYVYQALDGYIEHLANTDRWVGIEQLYVNLTFQGPQDLVDPPEVLARIAKEIIQGSVQRQSDVTAAMAARLNEAETGRLWKQQKSWRAENPDRWWAGVPPEWNW